MAVSPFAHQASEAGAKKKTTKGSGSENEKLLSRACAGLLPLHLADGFGFAACRRRAAVSAAGRRRQHGRPTSCRRPTAVFAVPTGRAVANWWAVVVPVKKAGRLRIRRPKRGSAALRTTKPTKGAEKCSEGKRHMQENEHKRRVHAWNAHRQWDVNSRLHIRKVTENPSVLKNPTHTNPTGGVPRHRTILQNLKDVKFTAPHERQPLTGGCCCCCCMGVEP